MKPEVMVNQVKDLPVMTREQFVSFSEAVQQALSTADILGLRKVYIVGDGDSYHAAEGAELAFKTVAQIAVESMSAQRFLDYAADWMESYRPQDVLVIGISASGRTERVVQSLGRARDRQALTLALTGTAESKLSQTADRTALVALPDMGPSPGIRTYNASLMGLYLLAIRLGEVRSRLKPSDAAALREELLDLAGDMESTLSVSEQVAEAAVAFTKDANKMMFVGSGPSYGSALFCAAKVVEASGVLAVGQDLEEWSHVERYAHPADLPDMPLFIIAPPGRSYSRAVELASLAKTLGRRVIAIVAEDDQDLSRHADLVFPIKGKVREEFSPLVYHIAVEFYSAYLTIALGRLLFQRDRHL